MHFSPIAAVFVVLMIIHKPPSILCTDVVTGFHFMKFLITFFSFESFSGFELPLGALGNCFQFQVTFSTFQVML